MASEPGYQIGRDEDGLTNREREARVHLLEQKPVVKIAEEMGLSRQRVYDLRNRLIDKGHLILNGRTYEEPNA